MEQKILVADTAYNLNKLIEIHLADNWVPIGEHKVVVTHEQKRYAGAEHRDTISNLEYSQTVRRTIYAEGTFERLPITQGRPNI